MRKKLFLVSLIVFLFTAGASLIFAQASESTKEWKKWDWKDYNLSFRLPTKFSIVEQSATRLVANDKKDITITIEPYKKARVKAKDVAYYGWEKRKKTLTNFQIVSEEDISKETPGSESYGMLGTGTLRNRKAIFVIVGYIDPNSSNNVMFEAIFWDNGEAKNDEFAKIIQKIATTLVFKK